MPRIFVPNHYLEIAHLDEPVVAAPHHRTEASNNNGEVSFHRANISTGVRGCFPLSYANLIFNFMRKYGKLKPV